MKPIGYANKLIKKYKTRCPFELAECQNIIIRYENLPSSIKGMTVKALRRRYILLNQENEIEWNRFVCAHELGHHVMHPGHSYQFLKDSLFVGDKYEREANTFATNLLVNKDLIEEDDCCLKIAHKFILPVQAIEFLNKV